MTTTAHGAPRTTLTRGRADLLAVPADRLPAAGLREALCELYEIELTCLAEEAGIGPRSGFALVAFGGLGRREVLPHSDLDLVLVHERRPSRDVGEVADTLWYPLWDAGQGLDHSVRTVDQCLAAAAGDVSVALSLLDARVIAGDRDLGARVVDGARRQWRHQIAARFDELVAATAARRARAGVIAGALGKRYRLRQLSMSEAGGVPVYARMRSAPAMMAEASPAPIEAGETLVNVSVSGSIELID